MVPSSRPLSTSRGRKGEKVKSLWDETYEPLVQYMLSSNGVRVRPAVEVGKKAVEYYRGQDFVKWILQNQELLLLKFPLCFPDSSLPLRLDDAVTLGNELTRLGFIYRAEYHPIANKVTLSGGQNSTKQLSTECVIPKWPKRLALNVNQRFDSSSFYVLVYEPPSSWPYILLTILIGTVLAVCMFPAWPLVLKLLIWYVSVVFMTFILGSIVLRLITFVLIWFFGADFWIFPNLFDEELGVVDSFRPLYSFDYRNDSWMMLAARLFLAIMMAGCLYQLSQTHSLSDAHRFATKQFLDVLDWGHQKLAAPPGDIDVPMSTGTGGDSIDVSCLKQCGFHSYNILKDECMQDCECMKEIIDTPCFKKCSATVQTFLSDAQTDICQAEMINDAEEEEEDVLNIHEHDEL